LSHILLFVAAAIGLTIVSWPALKNPGCHGFYRYFTFIGIAALFSLNEPYWTIEPTSAHQLVSWLLLFGSMVFVLSSFYLLRSNGGERRQSPGAENFAFENTSELVSSGIFGFIRHPMYASLLFLCWGTMFKHVTLLNLIIAFASSLFILKAARVEEDENIAYFGDKYRDYMLKTKRFIPFIL